MIYGLGGLSAPLFNFIGETIINPQNTVLEINEQYFNHAITRNLFKYYYVMLGGISVSLILSLVFTFQYDEEEYMANINVSEEQDQITETQENTSNKNNDDLPVIQNPSLYLTNMRYIFTSYRIWNIFLIVFFGNFLLELISISFKVIGIYARFQIMMLKTTASVMSLVKNAVCPLWGYLFDKYGYSPLIKVINIASITIGILMCLSTFNEVFFGFILVMNYIIIAGFRSITDPLVMKVFSIEYSMEIGGLMGFALGITSIFGTVVALSGSLYSHPKIVYLIIFTLGAVLNWVSLVISFFEDEKPFKYETVKEYNDNISNEIKLD